MRQELRISLPVEGSMVKIFSEATISLSGKIIGRIAQFGSTVLLARILAPMEFGIFAIGWSVLKILSTILPVGLDKAVIYFSNRRSKDPLWVSSIIAMVLILSAAGSLFSCALFLWSAPYLADVVFSKPQLVPVLRAFAIGFPFVVILRVGESASRVSGKVFYGSFSEDFLQPVLFLIAFIGLYPVLGRLEGAAVAVIISFAGSSITCLAFVERLFPGSVWWHWPSEIRMKELFAYSIPAASAGLFTGLTNWIDRLIVGAYRSPAEAGMYHAASQLTIIFPIILGAFGAIFGPMISKAFHEKKTHELHELLVVSTKWGLYFGMPFLLVSLFVPRQFMTGVFGQEFEGAAVPLLILSLGQIVNLGTGNIGLLLVMTGNQTLWLLTTAISFGVNVLLLFALVPAYGMIGASISTASTLILLFGIGLWQVKRKLGIVPYDRRFVKPAIAMVSVAVVLWLFRTIDVGSNMGETALVAGSSLIFYSLLLVFGIEPEEKQIYQHFRRRMLGKT